MKKTRTEEPVKPKTMEEKKAEAWKHSRILPKNASFGEPTYRFEKGDRVVVGCLQNCVVDDMTMEGGTLIYGFTYDVTDKRTGEVTRQYQWNPWYDVRPANLKEGTTNFTKDYEIDIRFYNSTIDSLLSKFYLHGVDMSPEYQRDYVWTDEDKEALLDSIFLGIEIGKFAFIHRDYDYDISYEILDGKQRLSTLLDFYENRLCYRGAYFNDLSAKDRYTFLNAPVAIGETRELTKEQIYVYFYVLNHSGRVMSDEQLEKVKGMIDSCKEETKESEEESEEMER